MSDDVKRVADAVAVETAPTETEVTALLRAAFANASDLSAGRTWERARFVDAERAERSGRTVVAAAQSWAWAERPVPSGSLRPYGVHQHTLLVGVAAAAAGGLTIDLSRFGEVGW